MEVAHTASYCSSADKQLLFNAGITHHCLCNPCRQPDTATVGTRTPLLQQSQDSMWAPLCPQQVGTNAVWFKQSDASVSLIQCCPLSTSAALDGVALLSEMEKTFSTSWDTPARPHGMPLPWLYSYLSSDAYIFPAAFAAAIAGC